MWKSHHDGRMYRLHVFDFLLLSWGRRCGKDCLTTPLTFSLLMFVWHTISWIWSRVWEILEYNQVFTPCTIHFQMNIFGYDSSSTNILNIRSDNFTYINIFEYFFWSDFHHLRRLEICRDRWDRRSCKIFPNCVKFWGNNANSLGNYRVIYALNE